MKAQHPEKQMRRKVGLAKRVKSNILENISRKKENRVGSLSSITALGMSVTELMYERISGFDVYSGRWVILPA